RNGIALMRGNGDRMLTRVGGPRSRDREAPYRCGGAPLGLAPSSRRWDSGQGHAADGRRRCPPPGTVPAHPRRPAVMGCPEFVWSSAGWLFAGLCGARVLWPLPPAAAACPGDRLSRPPPLVVSLHRVPPLTAQSQGAS